jgi:hypothetical protein
MGTRRTAVVLVVLVGSLVAAGVAGAVVDRAGSPAPPSSADAPPDETLIQPRDNGSLLWPYTSASRSVDGRTLAINVVVHGGPDEVRRSLTNRTGLEWNYTATNETDADADTHSVGFDDDGIQWNDARGSTRYTYVDAGPRGGDGGWVAESYQLHEGSYLGTRHHVRAYESPRAEDGWTALQVHAEYWDWFRLRHTVTNVQGAAQTVEADFIGEPYVSEVRREYHGNDRGYNDGWITAIELGLAAAVVGSALTRSVSDSLRRFRERVTAEVARDGQRILLVLAVTGLYLGVRTVGIALEAALPGVTPKLFAGLLYPVIAFGIPAVAALLARPLDRTVAFGLAVAGLGAAFVLDFSAVGVDAVPVDLILHRFALLVSVGLVAAGSASRTGDRDLRLAGLGAVGWVASLALPLFGVL